MCVYEFVYIYTHRHINIYLYIYVYIYLYTHIYKHIYAYHINSNAINAGKGAATRACCCWKHIFGPSAPTAQQQNTVLRTADSYRSPSDVCA